MQTDHNVTASLSAEDQWALLQACQVLEYPSMATRLMNAVGAPIESGFKMLPAGWHQQLQGTAEAAVRRALEYAVKSLPTRTPRHSSPRHYGLAAFSGAVGGYFGLPALALEMPATTVLILRTIAAAAREQGETIEALDAQLECVKVFAFGARSAQDDAAESGYYGVRAALAISVEQAHQFVAQHGIQAAGSPVLVRLIRGIAARFGVVMSEKAAAQAVPIVGAGTGALINTVFMQHFAETAQGHFTVRRLERHYGHELIQREYERLSRTQIG